MQSYVRYVARAETEHGEREEAAFISEEAAVEWIRRTAYDCAGDIMREERYAFKDKWITDGEYHAEVERGEIVR